MATATAGHFRKGFRNKTRGLRDKDNVIDVMASISASDVNPAHDRETLTSHDRKLIERNIQGTMSKMTPLRITEISVGMLSPKDIEARSVLEVTNANESGSGSVNDPALGSTKFGVPCQTCGDTNICAGHNSYVRLHCPVYHPTFLGQLAMILRCLCPSCGQLFPSPEEIAELNLDLLPSDKRFKKLSEDCKSGQYRCRTPNCTSLPRLYSASESSDRKDYENTIVWNSRAGPKENNILDPMVALGILHAFEYKDPANPELGYSDGPGLIGFARNKSGSYRTLPSSWIFQNFPILPPSGRPPTEINGEASSDTLTKVYSQIIRFNLDLKKMNDGMPVRRAIPTNTEDKGKYNSLKFSIVHVINNKDNRMKKPNKFECITKRCGTGKEGIVRKLALGKRTNNYARTVANPEATNEFDEVLVPRATAKKTTVEETVTVINRDRLTKCLRDGKVKRISVGDGAHSDDMFSCNSHIRNYILQPSDVVHRELQDGDVGIINRQPTLHRLGMAGYTVRIADSDSTLVLGIHLGPTAGLNADFDGDEMNFHAPQKLESIIEARTSANIRNCIMFESDNVNVAGVAFDSLEAAYKMTNDRVILTKREMYSLLEATYPKGGFIWKDHRDRVNKFGLPLFGGRSAFSAVLPPGFGYHNKDVLIVDGVLISGHLSKKHLGGSHNGIIQTMYHWSGRNNRLISDFITRASYMLVKYMTIDPTTVGFSDCLPANLEEHQMTIKRKVSQMKQAVSALGSGNDLNQAGKQRLEIEKLALIEQPAASISKKVMEELNIENSFLVSLSSEAKGSKFNLQQIMGILGQQFYRGARPENKLVYFRREDLTPEARGFVDKSFQTGLDLVGFIVHQSSSRFGILDTATKVSETGQTQRLLMKFMENFLIVEDGTVVNSSGDIIQFSYGYDGYDAKELVRQETSSGEIISMVDLSNGISALNHKYGYP